MLNPFKALGNVKTMRDQALKMQQELAKEEVIVEKGGVKVVMGGDQKIKQIVIDGEERDEIKEAVGEAIKQSQQLAAKKLAEMSGGMGGMLGGGK